MENIDIAESKTTISSMWHYFDHLIFNVTAYVCIVSTAI